MSDLFDVEIFVRPRDDRVRTQSLDSLDVGVHHLATSLKEAKRIAAEVRHWEGHALPVSVDYRKAVLTYEEAYKIAEEYFQIRTGNSNHRYGSIEARRDKVHAFGAPIAPWCETSWWYYFVVEDFTAAEQGWDRPYLTCRVDRLDGHVWTDDEVRALSTLLQRSF